jgi:hypothetical protein
MCFMFWKVRDFCSNPNENAIILVMEFKSHLNLHAMKLLTLNILESRYLKYNSSLNSAIPTSRPHYLVWKAKMYEEVRV